MTALREALSRALARAPHAALGEHEARVVEALRSALASVGGPCEVSLKIDLSRPRMESVRLGSDLRAARREAPGIDAVEAAFFAALNASIDRILKERDAEAGHVAP